MSGVVAVACIEAFEQCLIGKVVVVAVVLAVVLAVGSAVLAVGPVVVA